MAITKILPVRGQLKGCLDYAANPQKTEYFSTADMQRLIGYTQNKDKTEHQLYVSGFNCMPQNAYCIMQATKQRWGKPLNGGNVGYHIIQSFKPGEATPDQVHEIGCEFARRFLADRFECTVSTHLDKGHLHNHIVVNSVSFMDGRMFRNDFTTYYKGIRAISDELCRENRLSVVETDGHGKSYGEWKHEKEGTPTLRGMVKADLEMAMASADSFAGFIAELQQMGYKVKYGPKVTHMAVRHKDAQRNIRLDKISPRFSEDALRSYFQELRKLPPAMQQEYKQQTVPHPPRWQPKELPMPVRRRARCRSKLSHNCRKITGFMACYYFYISLSDAMLTYQLVSAGPCQAASDYDCIDTAPNDTEFRTILAKAFARCAFDYNTSVEKSDKILTLSTCTDDPDVRYLVVAKLIDYVEVQ